MQPRECHTDANANADANRIRTKNNKSPSPWVGDTNMARIGFIASEEMLFENDDDDRRWTVDACLYYKLTHESLAQAS